MEGAQCTLCHLAQAKFACSCSLPAILICAGCLADHIEAAGTHLPVPMQKKALLSGGPGNEVCDECRAKAAVRFCLCTTPLRKFCEGCDFTHYQKARHMTHSVHAISAYQSVASGKVPLETFRKKQFYINDFQLRIGEELVQFDTFTKQVEDEFGLLLAQITEKKEEILRDLQTQRVKLVAHLNEIQQIIENKRYAEFFEVATVLDEYILNGYSSLQGYSEKMFRGKLELQQIKDLLAQSVTYELDENSLLRGAFVDIPVLKGNTLRLYNGRSLQCKSITLSQNTNINNGTAICFIGADVVLCCGGDGHNDVYEVNIRSGDTRKVASTNTMRRWVGIWNYRGVCVYAFGGYNGSVRLTTSEKYLIERKTWTTLSNSMHKAKWKCSVCEHSTGLYISGNNEPGSSLECFNLQNETFQLLRTESAGCHSILLCVEDKLYLIRKDTVEAAHLSSGPNRAELAVVKTIPQIENGEYWLCQPAKRCDGKLVGLFNVSSKPCGMFSFDQVQVQFIQVETFTY